MSSTSRTRSPGSIVKPRRNSRRVVPSASRTSSAKIDRTPSWRAVSNARTTPPVVGPATRSTAGAPSSRRWAAAQNPHSSLVAAGSARTANFSTYASPWRPLFSWKWPSRSAPDRRKSSSVRAATAARVDASRAGLIVVMRSSVGSRPVFDALRRRGAGLPWQRGPDEILVGGEPAAAALPGEFVDEPDRERRVGEDRRAHLDRDRADREKVEDVG